MIGVGFIGLGGMGRAQVQAFIKAKGCRIMAGADPSPDCQAKFKELCPEAAVYADLDALLADAKVEAVVVAVPTGYHTDVALAVLASGRPLLLEKPMARTVAECHQLNEAAARAGQLLMVAHCRRYDPDWGVLADAYRSGKLGEQVMWRHVRAGIGQGGWFLDDRLSGGPLMDGAIHNQDFANWLFGEPADVVGGAIKMKDDCTCVDTASAIVRYRSGSQLLLSWSWVVRGQSMHDVLGAKGTFVFGPEGMALPDGMKGHCLIDTAGEKHLLTFKPANMYVAQAEHFLDCVAGKAQCLTPGSEAVKAVAVSEAILDACRTGQVCPVPW